MEKILGVNCVLLIKEEVALPDFHLDVLGKYLAGYSELVPEILDHGQLILDVLSFL